MAPSRDPRSSRSRDPLDVQMKPARGRDRVEPFLSPPVPGPARNSAGEGGFGSGRFGTTALHGPASTREPPRAAETPREDRDGHASSSRHRNEAALLRAEGGRSGISGIVQDGLARRAVG